MQQDKSAIQRAVSLFLVLDTIAITISVPYFVDFVIKGLGATAESASILIAIRATCTAFAAPTLGSLSDKFGRKPIALIVAFGSVITMLLELWASSFWTYAISRVTFGLTRAAMPVANGVLCDIFSSADERSQALSKNGASVGVGFLIGAALGGILVPYGFSVPTLVCLVAQIANIAVILMLWQETSSNSNNNKKTDAAVAKTPTPSFIETVTTVATNKATAAVFFVHVLLILATAGVQHAYLEYTRIQLDMSPGLRSGFLLSIGVLSAVVQSNLTPTIKLLGGKHKAMVIGCLVNAIINVIAPLSATTVFITVSLLSTFVGFLPILTLSILSKLSPQNVQGSIMGLNESLLNIGTVVGPLFCSFTAAIDYRIPFFTAAVLLFALMYKCHSMTEFDQKDESDAVNPTKSKKAE